MINPILFRKRLIPNECIELKEDRILLCNEDVIVTAWNALHPKKDLHHGYSCYFLKLGFKVSKFHRADNSLMYWYCDIVDYHYDPQTHHLIVTDLLADVILYPDGFVKIVDLDELADAHKQRLISTDQLHISMYRANDLLQRIYHGEFEILQTQLEDAIRTVDSINLQIN